MIDLDRLQEIILKANRGEWREVWRKKSDYTRLYTRQEDEITAEVYLHVQAVWSDTENVGKISAYVLSENAHAYYGGRSTLYTATTNEDVITPYAIVGKDYTSAIIHAQNLWAKALEAFMDLTEPLKGDKDE